MCAKVEGAVQILHLTATVGGRIRSIYGDGTGLKSQVPRRTQLVDDDGRCDYGPQAQFPGRMMLVGSDSRHDPLSKKEEDKLLRFKLL